jgi:hypothetical protein
LRQLPKLHSATTSTTPINPASIDRDDSGVCGYAGWPLQPDLADVAADAEFHVDGLAAIVR